MSAIYRVGQLLTCLPLEWSFPHSLRSQSVVQVRGGPQEVIYCELLFKAGLVLNSDYIA